MTYQSRTNWKKARVINRPCIPTALAAHRRNDVHKLCNVHEVRGASGPLLLETHYFNIKSLLSGKLANPQALSRFRQNFHAREKKKCCLKFINL